MRRIMKLFVGLLAGLFLLSQGHAMAKNKAAAEAYAGGDKKQAFELWKKDAEAGDAEAQLLIANMLATGDGVSQSYDIANIYYQLAADHGSNEAKLQLATSYRLGQGTDVDLPRAEELLKEVASAGHPIAQFDLAELYLEDMPDGENSGTLAAAWYEAAAVQGIVLAQVKLANLSLAGFARDGVVQVPKDPGWALTWFEIAKRNADGSLPESPISKRVYPLDGELPGVGKTLRQYVLDQYAVVTSQLPADLVAEVKASIDKQLAPPAQDVKTE